MIYGLSAAIWGEITIRNGAVVEGNFDSYPVVRLKDAPKTEVHLALTGGKKWGGIGEPGAAPSSRRAVTNAIYAATGKRFRSLPIRGQSLSGGGLAHQRSGRATPGRTTSTWLQLLRRPRCVQSNVIKLEYLSRLSNTASPINSFGSGMFLFG